MSLDVDQIRQLYEQRKSDRSHILDGMRQITEHYDGEITVPLPELGKEEKPAVANLLAEGIDQTAMRVSSTIPTIEAPAISPRSKDSQERARKRKEAVTAWWERNRIRHQMRFRARYLVAYGTRATQLKPDFDTGIPQWDVRNPLAAYPAPKRHVHDMEPADVIFLQKRTLGWLEDNYPEQARRIEKPDRITKDTEFEVLEYMDDQEYVIVLLGKRDTGQVGLYVSGLQNKGTKIEQLERFENRIGLCPVVMPESVSLNKVQGQFNQVMGMFQAQARLMALDLIAVEKSVFPDMAILGEGGRTPQLVDDEWKDGRTGEVNVIIDGKPEAVQLQPGFRTSESMDRLENAIRQVGVPSQFGGEVPTNIRTGRASEVTMSAQLDYRIQEYQETEAAALEAENKRAIEIAREYHPDRKFYFVVNFQNHKGEADYKPKRDLDSPETMVSYPMPGTDANSAIMGIGQRIGAGLMSRLSGMKADPVVDDPQWEYDRIQSEEMERATLASIQAMAQEGQIPPQDLARLDELMFQEQKNIWEALRQVQREAQERQAEEVEQGSPEARPGIAPPGAGAEQPEAIPEPQQSQENLQSLLRSLRQPGTARGGSAEGQQQLA